MTAPLDKLLGARLPGPPDALRQGPFRRGAFVSPLHSERRAARTGAVLGLAFTVCFLTGLLSHLVQHPPGWFVWPASPSGVYRVTQGVHVATGLISIPLLLVKLWTVYPKLFEWPPAGSPSRAVSRLSILVLVGASAMQLVTGLINIAEWYPWGFFFTSTHYWTGWIAIGAVAVHVGAKAPEIRRGLARRGSPGAGAGLTGEQAAQRVALDDAAETNGVPRRAFVVAAGLAVGAVTLTTVGQTVSPLAQVSVLSPRVPGVGPQGLPVRQTATKAGTTGIGADYRLVVEGPGVDRRPAVAQRQHPGRPLDQGLLAQPRQVAHVAAPAGDAHVAVGVDQAGQQVPAPADGLGTRHPVEGEPPAGDPEVAVLALGEDDAGQVQRGGGHRLSGPAGP